MRRLRPSELVREEIQKLFTTGVDEGTNILSRLAELGVRYLAHQALEQEQEDHLGRGRYERRGEHRVGWRGGCEDARLRTVEGEVAVRVPQVRGAEAPYRSRLAARGSGAPWTDRGLEPPPPEHYAARQSSVVPAEGGCPGDEDASQGLVMPDADPPDAVTLRPLGNIGRIPGSCNEGRTHKWKQDIPCL